MKPHRRLLFAPGMSAERLRETIDAMLSGIDTAIEQSIERGDFPAHEAGPVRAILRAEIAARLLRFMRQHAPPGAALDTDTAVRLAEIVAGDPR
jgi:hypothetical protein